MLDDTQSNVATAKSGIEYISPKILKKSPMVISEAILERIRHTKGTIETILAIKRYSLTKNGIRLDEPKKSLSLTDEEVRNLVEYLIENIEAFKSGLKKYITVNLDKTSVPIDSIIQIINAFSLSDLKNVFTETSESTPQLHIISNAIRIRHYKSLIKDFERRLLLNYPETTGVESWQDWFTKNYWFFGSNYRKPIPKAKINISGIMPDFLFPTIDGCIDGLDIKKPNISDIIQQDTNHPGCYYWSQQINEAIGQVSNYLYELDENRLKLAEMIGVTIARPRGIIVAGRSEKWTENYVKAYRKLSFSLHGIEIVTYDHLLERAKRLIGMLDQENS